MIEIVTIESPQGSILQRFLRTFGPPTRPKRLSLQQLWIDHKPSTVGPSRQQGEVIKLIKARRWHEYVKLLWSHSRTHKEVVGARLLQQLGLDTPAIHEMGISLPTALRGKYIGYYVMEDLNARGLSEAHQLFSEADTSSALRLKIIDNICSGLQAMYRNKIVFTDFHLANVFSDPEGNLTWIDTGVTLYHLKQKRKRKYCDSIHRLINYYSDTVFSDNEKQRLLQCLQIA